MSHISKVACEIKDLDALRAAAEKFGAELLYGKRTFKMYGSPAPCIHAIALKGGSGYEVGLTYKTAGDESSFELACDFYDGNLERAFGPQLTNLRNEYLAVVAEQQLQRRGYRVRRDLEAPAHQIRLLAVQ